MTYDSDDALERALFSLELEEPPVDLRASILSATIYRPTPIFNLREMMVLAVIAAVAIWLIVEIDLGGGHRFVNTLGTIGGGLTHAFANLNTLGWIAAGSAAAIWLTIFTGFQPRAKGVTAQHR
jgi:hypothetical protein